MIKEYCDRCEVELKQEDTSNGGVFADFLNGLWALLGSKEEKNFEICFKQDKKYVPLTLCKKCREDLKQFMEKTEIHHDCIAVDAVNAAITEIEKRGESNEDHD